MTGTRSKRKRTKASPASSKPLKKRACDSEGAESISSGEKRSDDEMDVAKSLADLPSSPLQISKTGATSAISPGLFNDLREITASVGGWMNSPGPLRSGSGPLNFASPIFGNPFGGPGSSLNSPMYISLSNLNSPTMPMPLGAILNTPTLVSLTETPGAMATENSNASFGRNFARNLEFAAESAEQPMTWQSPETSPVKRRGQMQIKGGRVCIEGSPKKKTKKKRGRKPKPKKAGKDKPTKVPGKRGRKKKVKVASAVTEVKQFLTPSGNNRRLNAANAMTMTPSPSERDASSRNPCNCKKSKCLKLYCECFQAGEYCKGCNCKNCQNNAEFETARQAAVAAVLERDPYAFSGKVKDMPDAKEAGGRAAHYKGCKCKKSGCLKKYCECYQWGVHCGDHCKCQDCKNFEGSEALAKRRAAFGAVIPPKVSGAMIPRRLNSSAPAPAAKTKTITPPNVSGDVEEPHAPALPSPRKIAARRRPKVAPKKFEKNEMVQAFGGKNPEMDNEIVVQIFSYLDDTDLMKASEASKTFERIALSDSLWKYPEQPIAAGSK